MRFLGLGIEDKVPDATTVWLFRQKLAEKGLVPILFEKFNDYLSTKGYEARGGQVLDASLVPVPKPHNTKAEKAALAAGKILASWQEKPSKRAQKDTEARWTKKNKQSHFGDKNHISIDVNHGFIRRYAVTEAAVHDSQRLSRLLDGENQDDGLWADSAYRSQAAEEVPSANRNGEPYS